MIRAAIFLSATMLVVVMCVVAICAMRKNHREPSVAEGGGLRAVEDSTGRKVEIPVQPKRILSLCSSVTDTLLRLGAESQLAAIDEYSRVIPGTSNLVVIGKGAAISQEQVLVRGIDLALVWWYQEEVAEMLFRLKIPVVRIRCGRAGDVPETIRLVGRCLGKSREAERLADDVSSRMQTMTAASAPNAPRVYLELYGPFKTIGRDTYLNDLIEYSGGQNIAGAVAGSVLYSAEQLIRHDPDVVLLISGFATPDSLAQRSGMSALRALRQNRVLEIDRYWLVAGAGFPDSVNRLRSLILKTN